MRVLVNRMFVVIVAVVLSGGCSVGMALHGSNTPDLRVIKQNASRGEVELQLGPPVEAVTSENGHIINIYEIEMGNDPSAGRAIGHAAMDVLTFGTWELMGTPIEALQGKKRKISVEYDANDRVVNVSGNLPADKK